MTNEEIIKANLSITDSLKALFHLNDIYLLLDAAREDEAKKWESQLKSEQERAGKLMEALVEVQAGSLTGQLTRPDMNKVASKAINEYNNKP